MLRMERGARVFAGWRRNRGWRNESMTVRLGIFLKVWYESGVDVSGSVGSVGSVGFVC